MEFAHDQAFASELLVVARPLAWRRPDGREALIPGVPPQALGDPAFCQAHGLKYPYMAGAMAHGIASVDLVVALAKRGLLAAFGAAGLPLPQVAKALDELQERLGALPFAVNLIHSPQAPALEQALVDLLLAKRVVLAEASAFMRLTLPLVYYRVKGLRADASGKVISAQQLIAKVSRVELARQFWAPPPLALLTQLREQGAITPEEFTLAQRVPMATDLTVEADSGGHTDNRPLVTLMAQMLALKDDMERRYPYGEPLRLGAAGGISTPTAAHAAFAMGAAYIVTGTINQACVEAGTSASVKELLAGTEQGDITMAPAADMFEMGVKVQVLKRGTMFPMQAQKLYELYRQLPGLDQLSPADRQHLETKVFRQSLSAEWASTQAFFAAREPAQIERAERDPKHKMALLFRAYLGQASHWAQAGDRSRRLDYQVWCGPAMPAFNDWTRGTCLEAPASRRVVVVAFNLLYHAAVAQRLALAALQQRALPRPQQLLKPKTEVELAAGLR